jgi:hypothetical protein
MNPVPKYRVKRFMRAPGRLGRLADRISPHPLIAANTRIAP